MHQFPLLQDGNNNNYKVIEGLNGIHKDFQMQKGKEGIVSSKQSHGAGKRGIQELVQCS